MERRLHAKLGITGSEYAPSMTDLYEALEYVQLIVFAVLGVAAVRQWLMRRTETTAWLALTFGSIATVVLTSRFLPESSDASWFLWVQKLEIAVIVLFPYFLHRFVLSLVLISIWPLRASTALTAVLLVWTFALPDFPGPDEPRPFYVQAYIYGLLVQWLFILGRVIYRLWGDARRQPTVARRRMRTMALGALGIALALVIAGLAPQSDEEVTAVQFATQLLGIASGPLFLLGFAPPPFVRALWRQSGADELGATEAGLMESLTPTDVVSVLLPRITALVGGGAAAVIRLDGAIIGELGWDAKELEVVAGDLTSGRSTFGGDPETSMIVPMSAGWLAVRAGALSPFFGEEEHNLLNRIALLGDLALGRAELYQQEQESRRSLKRSQDQLLVAQELASIGSWEWDIASGHIVWSDELYRIFGLRPEGFELNYESFTSRVHPDDKELVDENVRRALETGEPFDYQHRAVRPDGEIVVLHAQGAVELDQNGRPVRMFGTSQDITERKRQEEYRDRFIANAAHELRTPLTTLVGFVRMIADKNRPLAPAQVDQVMSAMLRSGERISDLVTNLLDLSRLQEGRISVSPEPVRVGELARDAVDASPPPEGKAVEIGGEQDLVVLADPYRISQVLTNLLTNSYRYGGTTVRVDSRAADDGVIVSVTDDGPGVEEDIIEGLFDPFTRGPRSSGVGGAGLGLAIVRMLVEANSGKIWYERPGDRGARFMIRLPRGGGR